MSSSRFASLWLLAAVTAASIAGSAGAALGAATPTTIKDPVTPSTARVDAGRLRIGDGSGPLTVDGSVSVSNPVATHPGSPVAAFTVASGVGGLIDMVELRSVAAGTRLALSSLTVSNYSGIAEGIWVGAGACGNYVFNTLLLQLKLASGETVHLPFPQPLEVTNPLAPDTPWCLKAYAFNDPSTGNEKAHFIVVGYEH